MGAAIYARHRCVSARRSDDGKLWNIELAAPDGGTVKLTRARPGQRRRSLGEALPRRADRTCKTPKRVRLIKGSHIVVPRLHDGDHAFILQNSDNRIVFVIPYEREFSLIGTTDIPVEAERGSRSARRRRSTISASSPATTWPSRSRRPTWCGPTPACARCSTTATTIPRRSRATIISRSTRRMARRRCSRCSAARSRPIAGWPSTRCRDLARFYPQMGDAWTAGTAGGRRRAWPMRRRSRKPSTASSTGAAAAKPGLPKELVRVLARRHGSGLDELLENVNDRGRSRPRISADTSTRPKCAT